MDAVSKDVLCEIASYLDIKSFYNLLVINKKSYDELRDHKYYVDLSEIDELKCARFKLHRIECRYVMVLKYFIREDRVSAINNMRLTGLPIKCDDCVPTQFSDMIQDNIKIIYNLIFESRHLQVASIVIPAFFKHRQNIDISHVLNNHDDDMLKLIEKHRSKNIKLHGTLNITNPKLSMYDINVINNTKHIDITYNYCTMIDYMIDNKLLNKFSIRKYHFSIKLCDKELNYSNEVLLVNYWFMQKILDSADEYAIGWLLSGKRLAKVNESNNGVGINFIKIINVIKSGNLNLLCLCVRHIVMSPVLLFCWMIEYSDEHMIIYLLDNRDSLEIMTNEYILIGCVGAGITCVLDWMHKHNSVEITYTVLLNIFIYDHISVIHWFINNGYLDNISVRLTFLHNCRIYKGAGVTKIICDRYANTKE